MCCCFTRTLHAFLLFRYFASQTCFLPFCTFLLCKWDLLNVGKLAPIYLCFNFAVWIFRKRALAARNERNNGWISDRIFLLSLFRKKRAKQYTSRSKLRLRSS